MITNPFKGLNPYSEQDKDNFLGREEEVEYLLQIIQKNKLITLTGMSGSGKTSLVLAGLIPRLRNGFLGQAGKEWSVCYCRPGTAPIENFVQSLTHNGALRMDKKSNTEDFEQYLNIIETKGNLGLIDIYKNSEIFNKKNLLVVVDQMEDLFNLDPYFEANKSNQDELLIEMLSRTVKTTETAIYVVLSIQSEYVSRLIDYSKLQEIRSKSQYSLQNISTKKIALMIKQQFNKNKIYFNDDAINPIIEKVSNDNSLLINFQFLCFRLFEKFSDQNKNLTQEEIDEVGGLNDCINLAYEDFFQSKNEEEKIAFEKLIRSFILFKEEGMETRCQQFKNIVTISGIETKQLVNLLFELRGVFGSSFDFIEPLISGREIKIKRDIKSTHYVSMKYQKARSWKHEKVWLEEEEDNYDKYKVFAAMTKRFLSGDGSLLISPELDIAVDWRKKTTHSLEWSKKYNEDYLKIIDYIDQSDEANKKKRKNEEIKLKRKRKITRQVISAMSLLVLVAFGMFINATISRQRAKENEKIAIKKSNLAQIAQEEAEKQTEKALLNEQMAEREKDKAQMAKLEAEDAKNQADLARRKAEISAINAQEQSERAKEAEKKALEQTKIALLEKDRATLANDKIVQLKNLAEIESEFYPSVLRLEKQISSSLENPENGLDKETIDLIEEALSKFSNFENLSDSLDIKPEVEGGYLLLQTALMALEGKTEYKNTTMKLKQILPSSAARSISANENIIAFGGDDGKLYLFDTSENSEVVEFKIKERIRSVLLLDVSNLLVGTFKGNIYKLNINESFSKNNLIANSDSPIKKIFHDPLEKKIVVISENEIIVFNESFEIVSQNQTDQIITAGDYKNQKLIMAQSNRLFQIVDDGLIPINGFLSGSGNSRTTSLFISTKYLFAGKSNGEIEIYTYENNDLSSLTFLNKILLHRTRVTKLLYLDEFETLYSSSLDNQILKFNLNGNNIENVSNNYIALNGHSKWVWDLARSKDNQGRNILVTVDEDGNVLSWYIELKDLAEKVETIYDVL